MYHLTSCELDVYNPDNYYILHQSQLVVRTCQTLCRGRGRVRGQVKPGQVNIQSISLVPCIAIRSCHSSPSGKNDQTQEDAGGNSRYRTYHLKMYPGNKKYSLLRSSGLLRTLSLTFFTSVMTGHSFSGARKGLRGAMAKFISLWLRSFVYQ